MFMPGAGERTYKHAIIEKNRKRVHNYVYI